MFGNKKSNLPPRPHPPLPEQILEDIRNAKKDDNVFKFVTKEESVGENSHYPMNSSDMETVYNRLKTYLSVKENLKELGGNLETECKQLKTSDAEMKKIADDIRKQAYEVLVKQ